MEQNIDNILASFKKIAQDAKNGEDNARGVANELCNKAAQMRAMADAMVGLARQLTGDASMGKPVVVLKNDDDAKAYKESKKKPAQKKKRKYHYSPEARAAAAERCKRMREAKAMRAKLMAVVENNKTQEANES